MTKHWRFDYPGWKTGAVTFSFDDNRVQDRRLVELFNRYGLKGTFNLNSGTLGSDDTLFIRPEEVKELYAGHEVASHSVNHPNVAELWETDREQCVYEILHDRDELERLSGQAVRGFVYPYGELSDAVEQFVIKSGFTYTRCGTNAPLSPPVDPMRWSPTAHQNENLTPYAESFLACTDELRVLLVWGHSFEFDWGKGHWDDFEAFCQKIAGRDELYYATMGEICDYWSACRSAVRQNEIWRNPSGRDLYLEADGEKILLPAGSGW